MRVGVGCGGGVEEFGLELPELCFELFAQVVVGGVVADVDQFVRVGVQVVHLPFEWVPTARAGVESLRAIDDVVSAATAF